MNQEPINRTHEQQLAYDLQRHELEMVTTAAERAHALSLVEYNRETDLARIQGKGAIRLAEVAFQNESQRSWRTGRLRLIFLLVGTWLAMGVVTLGFALNSEQISGNLALFISLIAIYGGVAIPASAILYAQGYREAQRAPSEED